MMSNHLIKREYLATKQLYGIQTKDTHEGFPLSKLLILITNTKLNIHSVNLVLRWLQPISLHELAQFPAKPLHEYQRNYNLLGLSERLGINQSQLLQLWNHTIENLYHGTKNV